MITYRPDKDEMGEATDWDAMSEALHQTAPCVLLSRFFTPAFHEDQIIGKSQFEQFLEATHLGVGDRSGRCP